MPLIKHNASAFVVEGKPERTYIALEAYDKHMILNCTYAQYVIGMKQYHIDGALVQNAFSFLTADEREFLQTGMTKEEWDHLFADEEESEEDDCE